MSYTKAEEQTIRDNEPVTYEIAEQLSSQFGKTVRSVISQSQKIDRPQKKDTVRAIERTFGLREGELQGLTNARGETLGVLYKLIAEHIN